jgi:4-hydroxy-tetrahydrodipicolinate synthase
VANLIKPALSVHKERARQLYKGVENFVLPSFAPNSELDEKGIRRDVRLSVAHGFFSTACLAEMTGLEQYKQMLKIACDEAAGRILVGAYVGEKTQEENIELLTYAKEVGCDHAVLVPRVLQPDSDEAIYAWYRELIDAVEIPICLYAQNNPRMRHLHASGMSVNVLSRLAMLPTVVAIKLSMAINLVRAKECADALGDKILLGPVHVDMIPLLAKHCHIQWSGQWSAECAQSPEKRYVTEFVNAIAAGDMEKAIRLYWTLEPGYHGYYDLQYPLLLVGIHPWSFLKYHQWCVGGNGGLVPDPHIPAGVTPALTAAARHRIRENFRKMNISVTDAPEEEFVVGMENYAKGLRKPDFRSFPLYED